MKIYFIKYTFVYFYNNGNVKILYKYSRGEKKEKKNKTRENLFPFMYLKRVRETVVIWILNEYLLT